MSKWSFIYLIIAVYGVALFVFGPYFGWSLPDNLSTAGEHIDHLFYVILGITGVVFIVTQGFIFYILFRFGRPANGRRALYTHGSRKVEILWTIVPAVVLLFIELYQINTWMELRFRKPNVAPVARVVARQFEWRMIYPGDDGTFDTPDDVHVANELHVPLNRRILIDLRSMDVLHSFFLPNMRIKQDAVPGLNIPVWFDVVKWDEKYAVSGPGGGREMHFDLICAELCGWGHYKMKGRLVVHETQEELNAWIAERYAEQEATK